MKIISINVGPSNGVYVSSGEDIGADQSKLRSQEQALVPDGRSSAGVFLLE